MIPVNISYPFFEANQVLSYEHLNQLFNYLDEQTRLSRTNLIGIGIVCGLRPSIIDDGNSIRISKGCGVTSEGYLIVWEDAFALEWYRPYTVPEELAYKEFEDRTTQPTQAFPMWELIADRNNDPNAVRLSRDFMRGNNQAVGEGDEKILVLFLECLAESNRNCTPNSCADKGTTVTAAIRPILIRKQDIDLLQERIHGLGADAAAYFSLTDTMGSRLGLPTLKLPRYNVGASNLGGTTAIFDAFQLVMNQLLIDNIATALSDAYRAFQPLLTDFTSNPFNNLATQWAYFYDRSIENSGLYLWYQYYYDHLDTVIQAYEEFRLRGLEVLGLCCPDSRLFPRHLMLGNVGTDETPFAYRHDFVPSPLFSGQSGSLAELKLLFQRLVSIVQNVELPPNVNSFVNLNIETIGNFPSPIEIIGNDFSFLGGNVFSTFRPRLSASIKITPSQLRRPLSQKAIPYHYSPVPLYEFWSYQKTRQQKARENLGYRSDSWNTTNSFVRFPLSYDLEPHNFLRIEGHIGQNYVLALQELLEQKERNRLPIDIIALKTGYNSDNIPLPNELANCHFQDLEVLYDAFKEELLCQICETVKHFYNIPILPNQQGFVLNTQAPLLPLLQNCSPNFRYLVNSVGEYYESNLNRHTDANPYFNFNDVNVTFYYPTYFIFSLVQLANSISNDLKNLDIDTFRQKYEVIKGILGVFNAYYIRVTNDEAPLNQNSDARSLIDLEEFSDQIDQILYACKLESIQQIWDEYQSRLDKVRQAMLFSTYADKHPGLQHKAGVPMGGTFIMVYHGEDQPDDIVVQEGIQTIRGQVIADGEALIGAAVIQLGSTNRTFTDFDGTFSLITYRLPTRLSISYAGFDTREILVANTQTPLLIDLTAPATGNTIGRFADIAVGTVIADFYLPYLCCSDCQAVQFVLPKAPPTFTWEQMGCTDDNANGNILITPAGGTPPYDYTTDSGANWNAVDDSLINVLNNAQIQIRDAEGTISVRKTISLIPPLVVRPDKYICQEDGLKFDIQVYISGGRPPYRIIADGQTTEVNANQEFGLATFPSGQGGEVIVEDSSTPPCQKSFIADAMECTESCKLPCEGQTRECGYPFWMQRNINQGAPYQEVTLKVNRLSIVDTSTSQNIEFDASQLDRLTRILSPDRDFNSAGAFTSFWNKYIATANEYIQNEIGRLFNSPEVPVLQLTYDPNSLGSFTTLRIEHYECHQFNFEIELNFRGSTTQQIYNRKWFYSNERAEVEEQSRIDGDDRTFESQGKIPAYNCILRNRCRPDEADVELCTKPFDVSIGEEPMGNGRYQFFLNTDTGIELPALWMVEHGMPAVGEGELIETNLLFPIIYAVMLIVVDPGTTCAAVARLQIDNRLKR